MQAKREQKENKKRTKRKHKLFIALNPCHLKTFNHDYFYRVITSTTTLRNGYTFI
jgi:hypothetical protein